MTLPVIGFWAAVNVPFIVKLFLIIDVPVPSTYNNPFVEISPVTKRRLFIDTSSLKSTDALVLLIRSVSPVIAVVGMVPLAYNPVIAVVGILPLAYNPVIAVVGILPLA